MMLAIGIMPASGSRLSCMVLTAPLEVSVVIVANRAELAMPNRTSLPSMLPPVCKAEGALSTCMAATAGLPPASTG